MCRLKPWQSSTEKKQGTDGKAALLRNTREGRGRSANKDMAVCARRRTKNSAALFFFSQSARVLPKKAI